MLVAIDMELSPAVCRLSYVMTRHVAATALTNGVQPSIIPAQKVRRPEIILKICLERMGESGQGNTAKGLTDPPNELNRSIYQGLVVNKDKR